MMSFVQFVGFILAMIGSVATVIIGFMSAVWAVRVVYLKLFDQYFDL